LTDPRSDMLIDCFPAKSFFFWEIPRLLSHGCFRVRYSRVN
jgi:hypothetical protein